MHDNVYNHFSTESNIGSRKICMDKLGTCVFVPPTTPLLPPALEMDTQDAGVSLIRSIAKLNFSILTHALSILSVLHISLS